MSLYPGKGAHLILNESVRDFVAQALADVGNVYSDQLHDANPMAVITLLSDPDDAPRFKWVQEKDNFGTKAYVAMPYRDGELRVTVVLTKKGELRLDIREWFTKD
jgi:hypothetical protein